jgi:hypothetical protein
VEVAGIISSGCLQEKIFGNPQLPRTRLANQQLSLDNQR